VLVNKHNKLYKRYTKNKILYSPNTCYFVEIVHNTVVGCVGMAKRNDKLTEIKHVCVEPIYRKRGIAKKIVNLAIASSKTEFVYMTIRHDNTASLAMAKSLGFMPVKHHWSVDHYVITMGRATNYGNWQSKQRQA
jgi:predicted GNAT family acetyltransferase